VEQVGRIVSRKR